MSTTPADLPLRGTMLDGKVALVSGIGPGMGRDISLALAAQGADLALGARREDNLRPVASEVEALGRRAVWAPTDICDRDRCQALVDATIEAYGRLDVLVNNAFHIELTEPVAGADLDAWRRTIETNLFGALQLTQAALPQLRASGNGRVVMVNTMATQLIEEGFGSYAASKAALVAATKTLAVEEGRHGIRANCIHPGHIWGPSVKWWFEHLASERGVSPQEVYEEVVADYPLGYLADSAELAGTVVYLASDLSRPVTGQSINVSCGRWMP